MLVFRGSYESGFGNGWLFSSRLLCRIMEVRC